MKVRKPWIRGHALAMTATLLLLILSLCQKISAQQVSAFSIAGWTAGQTPVFSGSNSNVLHLSHGYNLSTNILFQGTPNDGIGTDPDNVAFMNFNYSYTTYLTPAGESFSSASIPVGTHMVSAYQSCSSNMIPPWSIGCDTQTAVSGDSVNINVTDAIGDCIAPGNYQVDIVIQNYSVSSGGPHAPSIVLEWMGYNASRSLTTISTPASTDVPGTSLSPSAAYLLSQVAYICISKPDTCPKLNLSASPSGFNSASVVASYAGACAQNPCSYLWSDGETNPTAVHLINGTYTVTVTSPCGNTATASVTLANHITLPRLSGAIAANQNNQLMAAPLPAHHEEVDNNNEKKSDRSASLPESIEGETTISSYPNPAMHSITFDLSKVVGDNNAINIIDISGRKVIADIQVHGGEKASVSIDALPAGVYIYECASDKIYRGKFVKQ